MLHFKHLTSLVMIIRQYNGYLVMWHAGQIIVNVSEVHMCAYASGMWCVYGVHDCTLTSQEINRNVDL